MSHGVSVSGGHDVAHEHEHPGERTYIKVAVILSAITLVEVIIYYLGLPKDLLVGILLVLSSVKFATVVGYFMHLKFDDRRLLYIFGGALGLALVIVLALDALHKADSLDYAQDVFTVQSAPATE
jgi:cytochrome c oxidase subunit IV